MNIGEIKRYVNNGLEPLNKLIDSLREGLLDESSDNSLISVQKKMYSEIQQIKSKIANVGGDYYYMPDDGTGELIDSFEVYSNQNWEYLGQLLPKYNGMVSIRNKNEVNNVVLIDLFSTFANYQYGTDSSIKNFNLASTILQKRNASNPPIMNTFYPVIKGIGSTIDFPVLSGIPVFVYGYVDSSGKFFEVEMRARKVAK